MQAGLPLCIRTACGSLGGCQLASSNAAGKFTCSIACGTERDHRRDALWQVERAGKLEGPLLGQNGDWLREASDVLPLDQMNIEERLVASYAGTGLTGGKYPMHYRRQELQSRGCYELCTYLGSLLDGFVFPIWKDGSYR